MKKDVAILVWLISWIMGIGGLVHIACMYFEIYKGSPVTLYTLFQLVVDAILINIGLAMLNLTKD